MAKWSWKKKAEETLEDSESENVESIEMNDESEPVEEEQVEDSSVDRDSEDLAEEDASQDTEPEEETEVEVVESNSEPEAVEPEVVAVTESVQSVQTVEEEEFVQPEPVKQSAESEQSDIHPSDDNEYVSHLKEGRYSTDDAESQTFANAITTVFKNFDVRAQITGVKRGPRVTRFEVTPGRGVKIDKITKLRDELRLATASDRVNILTPVPGQSFVGIEVPRRVPDIISLGDVLRDNDVKQDKTPLLVGVGRTVEGTSVTADIENMPHMLVAGQTGSGKSSFINALICSLLIRNTPDQVRLLLIDPKRVELTAFRDVPHLALPVINDPEAAVEALKWIISDMESRYKLFEKHRVNKIQRYNLGVQNGKIRGHKLPRVVIVIDELADLMKTSSTPVEPLIIKLTQLGRAAGVHLVAATQRPSVDVITGLIKANIPTRVAFATASMIDSRVILDVPGAEMLVGEGDGLLSLTGSQTPVRFQGCWVDEDEIEKIVDLVIDNSGEVPDDLVWISQPPADLSSEISSIETFVNSHPEKHIEVLNSEEDTNTYIFGSETPTAQPMVEDALSIPKDLDIPEWQEPDWHEELELVKRRIEPCDLTGHMVEVSRRRYRSRLVDEALLRVQLRISKRFTERAKYRFKEQIDEDNAVTEALDSLVDWRLSQSNSVAWKLVERVEEEVNKANAAKEEAISYVLNQTEFRNADAEKVYRKFATSMVLTPLAVAYIFSVLAMTHNRFDWLLRHFPPFNTGLLKLFVIVLGCGAIVWIRAMWRYASAVARTQKDVMRFKAEYVRRSSTIQHASKQHVRLAQQAPLLEPLLLVLAKGYRAPWHAEVSTNTHVTTELDTSKLPACVTVARAVNGNGDKMNQLRQIALRQLVSPGWRTRNLEILGELHAAQQLASPDSLRLSSLDTDLGQSSASARFKLMEAFTNDELLERVGRARLISTIELVHKEVLRNVDSDHRPPVISTRVNGFEDISLNTSWLDTEDRFEDWLEFLEIVLKDTTPFSPLSIADKRSALNTTKIKSLAVVPSYFKTENTPFKWETAPEIQVAPIDVVVRIDVSDWADPSAFAVFANGKNDPVEPISSSVDSGNPDNSGPEVVRPSVG